MMSGEQKTFMSEESKSQFLYVASILSLLLLFVPFGSVYVLGFAFLICLVILSYMWRMDVGEYSLLRNHSTYIIRTFWIGLLFSILLIVLGFGLLYGALKGGAFDTEALEPCLGASDMSACLPGFTADNKNTLVFASIIVFVPVILYLLYRYITGWRCVLKGEMVSNPIRWF